MQINKNHFEIGEKRFVWNEAAKNVAKMAAQIEDDLNEQEIVLNDADKEKIAKYKEKKDEIIFWSKKEREKFAESLLKEENTNAIAKLIHAEIQNELFENKMDENVKDYEDEKRFDWFLSERDKNKTRDIIENAWASETIDLNDAQRKELEKKVLPMINAADKNSDDNEGEKHEIFKDVSKREGFASLDKMITKAEAEKIAEFIVAEAERMRGGKKDVAEEEKTDQTLTADEKIAAATEELGAAIKIENWANGKASAENLKLVEDHGGKSIQKLNAQIDNLASKYSFDAKKTKEVFKNLIALNIGWFSNEKNKKAIEKKFAEFDKQFKSSSQNADEFFKLKGIDWKNNPELLLRYFAFNDVEKNLESYRKFTEGKKEKLQQGETVEVVERDAEVEEVETDENDLGHGEKSVAHFAEATKLFDEGKKLWNSGKKMDAIKSFLFAFVSFLKGALYSASSQGGSLLSGVPKELGAIPLIGPIYLKVKGFISSAGDKIENLENPQTVQAITTFFGVDASNDKAGDEIKKIKSNLKKITIGAFLNVKAAEKGKDDPMKEFKTENDLTLTATQLRQLQKKLISKNESDPNIKNMKVFNLLKKRIDKENNPNYLA